MKLLSKTSRNYLWVSFTVMAITGVLLFFFLLKTVSEEIREQLELQSEMVTAELTAGKIIRFPLVQINSEKTAALYQPPIFRDTLMYDHIQKKKEGYYYLKQTRIISGKPVSIMVMTTHIGWDGYTEAIVIIFIVMACMLVFAGGLVNYFINRKLWTPFLLNLHQLKSYSVSSKTNLQLIPSPIDEFKELNIVIADLAKRARKEYTGLKEFTENASHEIQTPLTIIKSRLESISQLPIDAELANYLLDAKQALDRLSKLNKGLLLLAKLDNDTFPDQKRIDLGVMLRSITEQMEDLFEQRGIKIITDIQDKKIYGSPYLLEILISNLLSNMRLHAKPNGQIKIMLDNRQMAFSNEGDPMAFPEDRLFTRFGKTAAGYNGNGLGLSIIKQICIAHQWSIVYFYDKNVHVFEIKFQ